uniref:Uncharacterized protein n=1 Tax=Chelonoidis abingdonii TaxID=106734 RepID=A0A8C0JE03_CHEAB
TPVCSCESQPRPLRRAVSPDSDRNARLRAPTQHVAATPDLSSTSAPGFEPRPDPCDPDLIPTSALGCEPRPRCAGASPQLHSTSCAAPSPRKGRQIEVCPGHHLSSGWPCANFLLKIMATCTAKTQTSSAVKASHVMSLRIATSSASMQRYCGTYGGNDTAKKLNMLSVSNDTVKRRICEMFEEIKKQAVHEIKHFAFSMFSLQLDETTDVTHYAQLIAFVQYVNAGDVNDKFLFREKLETPTTAQDIFNKVNAFFESNGIEWKNLCGICTNGAPAMMGARSGFQQKVKCVSPNVIVTHCGIHRQVLAAKTLPICLNAVVDVVIRAVNYMKAHALNSRLFRELCNEMSDEYEVLLFHTHVQWLSRGRALKHVFMLHEAMAEFFLRKQKQELNKLFSDKKWLLCLAYLVDIFGSLNDLNLSLQGKHSTLIDLTNKIKAFQMKLDLWCRKPDTERYDMFPTLSSFSEEEEVDIDSALKSAISEYLRALLEEFSHYFPVLPEALHSLVKNLFNVIAEQLPTDNIHTQEQFINMIHDNEVKEKFTQLPPNQFWCSVASEYPLVSEMALKVLLPFPTTFECEYGFSSLLTIKRKSRNWLDVKDDIRCAFSKTPRIKLLVSNSIIHLTDFWLLQVINRCQVLK